MEAKCIHRWRVELGGASTCLLCGATKTFEDKWDDTVFFLTPAPTRPQHYQPELNWIKQNEWDNIVKAIENSS